MRRKKKHLIDGEYFTLLQLVELTGKSLPTIRLRVCNGAETFEDLTCKHFHRISRNWTASMMNDRHGHWKLLAKSLRC